MGDGELQVNLGFIGRGCPKMKDGREGGKQKETERGGDRKGEEQKEEERARYVLMDSQWTEVITEPGPGLIPPLHSPPGDLRCPPASQEDPLCLVYGWR
jgi:hypothetical protein